MNDIRWPNLVNSSPSQFDQVFVPIFWAIIAIALIFVAFYIKKHRKTLKDDCKKWFHKQRSLPVTPFTKGFLSALLLIIAVIAVAPISPWISAVLVGIATFYLLPLTAILFVGQWESQFLSQIAASLLIITPIIFGCSFELMKKHKAVLIAVLILAALNSYIVLQLLSDNFIVE